MSGGQTDFSDYETGLGDTGTSDRGVGEASPYGQSDVSPIAQSAPASTGDADGAGLTVTEMIPVIDRLRRCRSYTAFLIYEKHKNEAIVNITRPDQKSAIPLIRNQINEMRLQPLEVLKRVYGAEFGMAGYSRDRASVKLFVAEKAQIIGQKIFEYRGEVTAALEERYDDDKDIAELARDCSIMLSFRTGLPLCETHGSDFQSILPGSLAMADTPDTEIELKPRIKAHYLRYPPTPSAQTKPYIGKHVIRTEADIEERFKWKPKWQSWSQSTDEKFSPFVDRFAGLYGPFSEMTMDEIRADIYKRHPIAMILHTHVLPYDLADILRLRLSSERDKALRSVIRDIQATMKKSNKKFIDRVRLDDPFDVDWEQHRPLLRAATTYVTPLDDDPILELLGEIFGELDNILTWAEITDIALIASAVLLICVTPYIAPVVGTLLGVTVTAGVITGIAGGALTVAGLGTALWQLQTAREMSHADFLDQQFSSLDGGIRTIENKTSLNGAYISLILEVMGLVPFGKILKSIGVIGDVVPVKAVTRQGNHGSTKSVDAGLDKISERPKIEMPDAPTSKTLTKPKIIEPNLTDAKPALSPNDADFEAAVKRVQNAGVPFDMGGRILLPSAVKPASHGIKPLVAFPANLKGFEARFNTRRKDLAAWGGGLFVTADKTVIEASARHIRKFQKTQIQALDDLSVDKIYQDSPSVYYLNKRAANDRAILAMSQGITVDVKGNITNHIDLPAEFTSKFGSGGTFRISQSGNLLYRPPGKHQGASHVFPALKNPPSKRKLFGYQNLPRRRGDLDSEYEFWYDDLRYHWEDRGLAYQYQIPGEAEPRWMMFDTEMGVWMPEEYIDMGHIISAAEHNQMMLEYLDKARRGALGVNLTSDQVLDRIRRCVASFRADHQNYLPQFSWRNRKMGAPKGLRYGILNPDFETMASGKVFLEPNEVPFSQSSLPKTYAEEALVIYHQQLEGLIDQNTQESQAILMEIFRKNLEHSAR